MDDKPTNMILPSDVEPKPELPAFLLPPASSKGNVLSEPGLGISGALPGPVYESFMGFGPTGPTGPTGPCIQYSRAWLRRLRVFGYHLAAGAIGATCAMFVWNAVTAQGGQSVHAKDKGDKIVPIPVKTIHYRVVTPESNPLEAEAKAEPIAGKAVPVAKKPVPKKRVYRNRN
jgi:hypothetical protein